MIVPLDYVPKAAQGLSQVNNTDGDAFTIIVDGLRIDYELDNNSLVTAGRVRIPMGASATETVQNIVTVLTPLLQGKVRLVANGSFLDAVAVDSNIDLQMGYLAGGSLGGGLVNSAQRVLPTACVMLDRQVYPQDVTRGKVMVYHQIDNPYFFNVNLCIATNNLALIAWSGTVDSQAGVVALVNGGSSPYVVNNVFKLIVIGDRYE